MLNDGHDMVRGRMIRALAQTSEMLAGLIHTGTKYAALRVSVETWHALMLIMKPDAVQLGRYRNGERFMQFSGKLDGLTVVPSCDGVPGVIEDDAETVWNAYGECPDCGDALVFGSTVGPDAADEMREAFGAVRY